MSSSGLPRDSKPPIQQKLHELWSSQPLNLWNNAKRSVVSVKLLEEDDHGIFGILERYRTKSHARQALVEFPGVLVPSFRPTLQALQLMSRSLDIPFSDHLAPTTTSGGVIEIPPPQYALGRGFQFDLSSITNGTELKVSPQERFHVNSLDCASTLDFAQSNALVSALTRSLALVQGPPGTGKSFVAVQIVKVLLAHRETTNIGPIICVYVHLVASLRSAEKGLVVTRTMHWTSSSSICMQMELDRLYGLGANQNQRLSNR